MWVRALNGNVIEVPEDLVPGLVAQGHKAFPTEAEARGVEPRRAPVKRKS